MKKIYLYLVLACIVIFIGAMLILAHSGKTGHALVRVNPASLNAPVTATLFKFTPAIKGKTYWSDSSDFGRCPRV